MKVITRFETGDDIHAITLAIRETVLAHLTNPHTKIMAHGRPHYYYRYEFQNPFVAVTCVVREIKDGISVSAWEKQC